MLIICSSWTIVGIALRFAYRLGLHIQSEDTSVPPVKQEMLRRTWWSLSILEQNLCSITGRPSTIMELFCSVPLLTPGTEERIMRTGNQAMEGSTSFLSRNQRRSYHITQPSGTPVAWQTLEANSGSYFKATVELSIIVRSILTSLYSAASRVRSARELQQDMIHLGSHLDNWELSLPK